MNALYSDILELEKADSVIFLNRTRTISDTDCYLEEKFF